MNEQPIKFHAKGFVDTPEAKHKRDDYLRHGALFAVFTFGVAIGVALARLIK
jgi:hypothetical protein